MIVLALQFNQTRSMFRSVLCLPAAALVCGALHAQTPTTTMTEMKAAYTSVKNNLIKAAEKVPDAAYEFKPEPEVRTIGALLEHIASAHVNYCGRVTGNTKPLDFGSHTKESIVAGLKASFDNCDAGWEALTEANAGEMTGQGRGALTKYGAMLRALIHDNEEYGYLSVYLRLKGIVPPSSEGGMGRGGRGRM
jgi:uncharacterized damage-inducible protein DinB